MNEVSNYKGIPAMTSPQVHSYLHKLGMSCWNGGICMELGCWLGGSSVPLLEGLVKVGYNQPFWASERWIATQDQIPKASSQGVSLALGQDTLPIYLENVKSEYKEVLAVKGNLSETVLSYNLGPIDICLFDAPKQEPVFTNCLRALLPYFVPGQTVLGLLDYKFYERHVGPKRERFRAPVTFMEKHGNHFSVLKEWDNEAVVFFRYENELSNV